MVCYKSRPAFRPPSKSAMQFRPLNVAAWLVLPLISCLSAKAQPTNVLQFTGVAQTSAGIQLNWSSPIPGSAYTVQFQDAPQDQIWRVPGSLSLPLLTNSWTQESSTNATQLFR